jgi:protein tyrosine phosphatase
MSDKKNQWPLVMRLREGRTNGSYLRWTPSKTHIEAADAIEALTAELREARMQMLSDAGQAAEAYEAQLRAEAACNAVMKDRAQIMQQRDAALAQVERMRHE